MANNVSIMYKIYFSWSSDRYAMHITDSASINLNGLSTRRKKALVEKKIASGK
jgi:hypothetical protein